MKKQSVRYIFTAKIDRCNRTLLLASQSQCSSLSSPQSAALWCTIVLYVVSYDCLAVRFLYIEVGRHCTTRDPTVKTLCSLRRKASRMINPGICLTCPRFTSAKCFSGKSISCLVLWRLPGEWPKRHSSLQISQGEAGRRIGHRCHQVEFYKVRNKIKFGTPITSSNYMERRWPFLRLVKFRGIGGCFLHIFHQTLPARALKWGFSTYDRKI